MNQKGFAKIILVGVIVVLIGIVGYLVLVKRSEPTSQQPSSTTNTVSKWDYADETKNWKTYRNESVGFEFKYPNDFTVFESQKTDDYIVGVSNRDKKFIVLVNVTRIDSDVSLYDFANSWGVHMGKADYSQADLKEVTIDGRKAVVKEMKEKNPELPQITGFPLIKTFIDFKRPLIVDITTGIDFPKSEQFDTEKVFNSLIQLNNSILFTFNFLN